MNLFIQVENNQVINHPAVEENLMQVFGTIPANWEPFMRVSRPIPDVYQVLESDNPTYEKINDVWADVWAIRDMTSEEKIARQNEAKSIWMASGMYHPSWIFEEETCTYIPPVPYPMDGKQYVWDENTISWIENTVDK